MRNTGEQVANLDKTSTKVVTTQSADKQFAAAAKRSDCTSDSTNAFDTGDYFSTSLSRTWLQCASLRNRRAAKTGKASGGAGLQTLHTKPPYIT